MNTAERRRYALLGAGPPKVLASKLFGVYENPKDYSSLTRKGVDIAIGMFRAFAKYRFWHWTKHLLDQNNHTLEVRMLGARMILTDDPENIKAILDTQFHEVGKSKFQHEIFKHILGDAIFSSTIC